MHTIGFHVNSNYFTKQTYITFVMNISCKIQRMSLIDGFSAKLKLVLDDVSLTNINESTGMVTLF